MGDNKNNADGLYLEFFVMKDNQRYNYKTISLKEVVTVLAESTVKTFEDLLNT